MRDSRIVAAPLAFRANSLERTAYQLTKPEEGRQKEERHQKYDVVGGGGGLAAVSAAIAAARHGASVALVQDRPVLGREWQGLAERIGQAFQLITITFLMLRVMDHRSRGALPSMPRNIRDQSNRKQSCE